MANIFGTTEEEEDNLLRLYNPQEYYLQNPYLPPVAQPIAPTPDPIITGGGGGGNNGPNADPFGTMDGTYQPNPNILGQYVGYFDPTYDPAPGGVGSTFTNPDGTMGSLAPDSISGDFEGPMTPLGMSFEDATNAFNDDNDDNGFLGGLSLGDMFGLARNISPTVMGAKTIGFFRDIINNAVNYESPEDSEISAVSYNDVNAAGPNSANSVSAGAMAESYDNIAREMRDRGIGFGENSGPGRDNTGAGDSIGGCFIKGTMVEMADGTEKEITSISVGEETKGGTVQAKMEYMPHRIYDYKGVKVSGSHWVLEDGQFTEVENSKHGVLTDMIEPVYNFMTSKHRIFIKGVEFGGFYSQNPDYYEPYFKEEKIKINKELSEKTT